MASKHVLNFILSLGFFSIFLGVFRGEYSIKRYMSLVESKEVMTETVTRLNQENEDLEHEITKLQNSKGYAQKVLRDKYHILEEDESLIFFAD